MSSTFADIDEMGPVDYLVVEFPRGPASQPGLVEAVEPPLQHGVLPSG
jgi:hypothetical protein